MVRTAVKRPELVVELRHSGKHEPGIGLAHDMLENVVERVTDLQPDGQGVSYGDRTLDRKREDAYLIEWPRALSMSWRQYVMKRMVVLICGTVRMPKSKCFCNTSVSSIYNNSN